MRYKKTGITLLEMMIAMVLLTIVSSICYSTLNTAFSLQQRDYHYQKTIRKAQIVVEQMTKDLRCAFQRKIHSPSKFYRYFQGHSDKVYFVKIGHSGPAEISYILEVAAESTFQLLRRYNSVAHEDITHGTEGDSETKVVVLENISRFQLRYLDYEEHYHNSWPLENKIAPTLPRAVEIAITITIGETSIALPTMLVEVVLGGN